MLMGSYWNARFANEGMIWGTEPSQTALHARDIFLQNKRSHILVPGAGYGRNTKALSSHFRVTGLELSMEAMEIGKQWDPRTTFVQGSVLDDPGTASPYDAIYCYDVLHLFLEADRHKFVDFCAKQLADNGLLYITSFSDSDPNYGVGKMVERDTYEYKAGKYAHFFTDADLREHFREFAILETGSVMDTVASDKEEKQYHLRYLIAVKS